MELDVTEEGKSDSSSGNTAVVVAVIVVAIVVVIVVALSFCCVRRQKPCFDKAAHTHMPLGSSESVNRQFPRDQHATPGSIRSA